MMMHPYESMNHPAYEGMPGEDLRLEEDSPLFEYLLYKIRTIPYGTAIWGKRYTKDEIVDEGHIRKYEFQSDGILYLYIKQKDKFFNNQVDFLKTGLGLQKIPLTYKTMSNMTEDEVGVIYTDFD